MIRTYELYMKQLQKQAQKGALDTTAEAASPFSSASVEGPSIPVDLRYVWSKEEDRILLQACRTYGRNIDEWPKYELGIAQVDDVQIKERLLMLLKLLERRTHDLLSQQSRQIT